MEEENPYIPKFISDAPWYVDQEGGRLDHQKDKREKVETGWYDRGEKRKASAAKKYRKGACTNCGSMTHKTKDCFERPRKRGAKLTNMNIRADDELEEIQTTYDSKRDAWNGYKAEDYKQVIEQYEEEERLKKEREKENGPSDDDEDVDKEKDLPASERSRSMRTMDDKAQYLKNLDADDYNPRLRMMKEVEERLSTGGKDDTKVAELAVNPTAHALKNRNGIETSVLHTSDKPESEFQKSLLEKYGTTTAKPAASAPRIVALSEQQQQQQQAPDSSAAAGNGKSKYQEDVFPGNHTAVWGSYWKDGAWGYKCCKSHIKNSYCMAD